MFRIAALFLTTLSIPVSVLPVTPACAGYTGWNNQTNPRTDATGLANTNFPEASATTYWGFGLSGAPGTVLTIRGRYPLARFMSLEITTSDMLVDYVDDVNIAPDPGENNPFLSGTANGTFAAYVVIGAKPPVPAQNTLYTGTLTTVRLAYRIYHATDPNDPAAGAVNPVLPDLFLNGQPLTSCPVQPIIQPPYATAWGRLALGDWHGTAPTPDQQLPATNPARWVIQDPDSAHYFPNGANYYMGVMLSRQFLAPYTSHNLFVVRFKAPTFPNTRAGEPVHTQRQVRFWSLCTDDPYTTNVNRCVPDDGAALDARGYATFVVSDPGSKPSDTALQTFRARWIPWGALYLPDDVVYDRGRKPWGLNTPVHFYNMLIYRQTQADPSFTQSMKAISLLPPAEQRAAMGPYWPVSGYCSKSAFETKGVNCLVP
jgi:hypothetical protein